MLACPFACLTTVFAFESASAPAIASRSVCGTRHRRRPGLFPCIPLAALAFSCTSPIQTDPRPTPHPPRRVPSLFERAFCRALLTRPACSSPFVICRRLAGGAVAWLATSINEATFASPARVVIVPASRTAPAITITRHERHPHPASTAARLHVACPHKAEAL